MNDELRLKVEHRFLESQQKLSLDIALPGAGTVGIFGPSGSGKTTLLRIVAGLLRADQAEVSFASRNWQSRHEFVPAHERSIGYVAQSTYLFPHLTVAQNIHYGYQRSTQSDSRIDLNNVFQTLDINNLLNRKVDRLSGGENQRVALARALASGPDLLLLDEPLSALDAVRKQEILPFLAKIKTEFSLPMLYVSHSADELALLADYLVVLAEGQVRASGPIASTYPELGGLGDVHLAVLLEARIARNDPEWHLAECEFPGGQLLIRSPDLEPGAPLRVRIQARDVSFSHSADAPSSILNRLPVRIVTIEPGRDPAMCVVTAEMKSESGSSRLLAEITAKSAADLDLEAGLRTFAQIKSAAIIG